MEHIAEVEEAGEGQDVISARLILKRAQRGSRPAKPLMSRFSSVVSAESSIEYYGQGDHSLLAIRM